MAKRKATPKVTPKATEILESQKTQDIQEKVTVQLQKNTAALIKTSEDIAKTISEKTLRLEELRQDFIREENKMVEVRTAHEASMTALEDETKTATEDMIEDAKEKALELTKNAQEARAKVISEKVEELRKINADFEFQVQENSRNERSAYLNDQKTYFSEYCEENSMAIISVDNLTELNGKIDAVTSKAKGDISIAVNSAVKATKDAAEIATLKMQAEYDNTIAKMQPEIDSLTKELARAEERASEFKQIIDDNRKAQVSMSANQAFNVNVDATKGK